jgi:hypothetical protein
MSMRLRSLKATCEKKEQLSWKQGLHATTHLPNGDKYIGEWKDDMKHGAFYF